MSYLPDAMAWSAGNILDPEVGGAGADGDAVVAGLDLGVRDHHSRG